MISLPSCIREVKDGHSQNTKKMNNWIKNQTESYRKLIFLNKNKNEKNINGVKNIKFGKKKSLKFVRKWKME